MLTACIQLALASFALGFSLATLLWSIELGKWQRHCQKWHIVNLRPPAS